MSLDGVSRCRTRLSLFVRCGHVAEVDGDASLPGEDGVGGSEANAIVRLKRLAPRRGSPTHPRRTPARRVVLQCSAQGKVQ